MQPDDGYMYWRSYLDKPVGVAVGPEKMLERQGESTVEIPGVLMPGPKVPTPVAAVPKRVPDYYSDSTSSGSSTGEPTLVTTISPLPQEVTTDTPSNKETDNQWFNEQNMVQFCQETIRFRSPVAK